MKKHLSNITLAIFFIFWISVVVNIINPFQQVNIITFPTQTHIYNDIYKLIISSSLLTIFLIYRSYKTLTDNSKPTYIQSKNTHTRTKYLVTILIPLMIAVPIVYAYVYEQNNNNVSQTIIHIAIMDEDFDDVPPGDDPPGWAEDSGDWAAYNDSGNIVYYQNDTAPKETITISITGNASWTDYTFEVDLKFDEGDTQKAPRGALLVYRYTGGNDYYFLALREAQDELEVYKHGTAGGGHLVRTASCTLVQDTWYHVNITIIGNYVWISIDDTPYFTNLDMLGDQISGSVGIGTEYYKVMFDNIYVDEL
jgi:hypothetical protein